LALAAVCVEGAKVVTPVSHFEYGGVPLSDTVGSVGLMQRVLSADLWIEIRANARTALRRKAAIAYVTRDSIGFRKDDVLVVNASERAIKFGETDAKLLQKLQKRGVRLYNSIDLHAKVFLLDDVAVVSSANMSRASADRLVEAGVITDHSSTVSAVASFLEQLMRSSVEIKVPQIVALCKIKVIRRGRKIGGVRRKDRKTITPLGNQTWLIGVKELVRNPAAHEKKLIDRATESLRIR
jgi:phosphatidylserine/phosphatidylglycerophosphate/cardiolipin synthase-like enzyme